MINFHEFFTKIMQTFFSFFLSSCSLKSHNIIYFCETSYAIINVSGSSYIIKKIVYFFILMISNHMKIFNYFTRNFCQNSNHFFNCSPLTDEIETFKPQAQTLQLWEKLIDIENIKIMGRM